MADGRQVGKYWHTITHLAMDYWDETWLVASHHVPDMSAKMGLPTPWQRPLPGRCRAPSNGAVDIQQLWASGGRTREPIWMKFGIQQQIRTSVTVMWSNIKSWRTVVVGKYSKWIFSRSGLKVLFTPPKFQFLRDFTPQNLGVHRSDSQKALPWA